MNCNEIRELISSMLDHELSAEDSAVVSEHLADCPECMRVFEAFHAISVSLEELEDVPAGFTEAVMHKINTPVKKRRPHVLRLAGLAACLALVIFAGSQFTTSHLHSDDRNIQNTAEYARVTHQTPKPTPSPTPAVTGDVSPANADELTPSSLSEEPAVTPSASEEPTPTPEAASVVTSVPDITPTPKPDATPRPTATPQPSPIPSPSALNTLSDLLYPAEEAAFDLFTKQPAYTLTVQDKNGNDVVLHIWTDGNRIYCKDLVEGTAWYAVGTPEALALLLNVPSPTVSPQSPA